MSEKFKDAFNVQMAVPAWALISFLASGIFAAGAIYQKLNTLADNYGQTANKVSAISDKQIISDQRINNVETQQVRDGARITSLEQSAWGKK